MFYPEPETRVYHKQTDEFGTVIETKDNGRTVAVCFGGDRKNIPHEISIGHLETEEEAEQRRIQQQENRIRREGK